MAHCPSCLRPQHYVCGAKNCTCRKNIPPGEKPQTWRYQWRRIRIPRWLFMWLWHHDFDRWNLPELLQCPYCGYSDLYDNWFEIDIQEVVKAGAMK